MSNAGTNMSKSMAGQMSDTTFLSSLTEQLTKLEALYTEVRTVETQVTQAVSELHLSELDRQIGNSLSHLLHSICGSMFSTANLQSALTATIKQLSAPEKSTSKSDV